MEVKRGISEITELKICLDKICQFMSLCKADFECYEKKNRTTKDYSLHQFQCYVGRRIDQLEQYPPKQMTKFLNSNNTKCKRN